MNMATYSLSIFNSAMQPFQKSYFLLQAVYTSKRAESDN